MLKRRLCEARFEWNLSCEGPLLIADGRYEKTRVEDRGKLPDKLFISRTPIAAVKQLVDGARSAEDLSRLAFYVPGTSLRGPLRSQVERILRTVIPGVVPGTACDPFQQEAGAAQSCSKRLDENHAAFPYAVACPACRLFGCTGTASRIQISDAEIGDSARSVFRDMIGIDRFTGGVHSGANMRFHVLEGASFSTSITLTNFELWQLGLLAFAFRDFEEGLVSIGFGKTKGFGQVRGSIAKIQLAYPKGRGERRIQHLQSLASDGEQVSYGLHASKLPDFTLPEPAGSPLDLFETYEVSDVKGFWKAVAPAFTDFAQSRQVQGAA